MDSFNFIKCNDDNIEEIKNLHVRNDQLNFVESSASSIEEAIAHPYWNACGIYLNNKTLIGFAMFGLFQEDGVKELWIDRFFIDKKYQHHGYGKESIIALIELLKENYDEEIVYLSVYENNDNAIHLYESIGFRFDGKLDINGELVMEKRIK